ncbi:MAG: DNA-directed RNA polymerase subunit H [Methanomassiliicoccales archaeon PtaU1.Bin030]|nr:DNA-directed RNA polymerase subunit H [Thermotogaceae bacterium]OPY29763.1 MAG: DNA-directed RNA polymerase subunit H [Methanomassiliicoccales archaeon PtaU1.Bin030]
MVESDLHVLEHDLVPEHTLLSEQEAEKVLAKFKITKDQLPKIRKDDACIRILERIEGPINPGRVIQIRRKSDTAEEFIVYRLVISKELKG